VRPCRRSLVCRTACLVRSLSSWTGFIGAAVDVDNDGKVEVGLVGDPAESGMERAVKWNCPVHGHSWDSRELSRA
jgi:hypothetical protein